MKMEKGLLDPQGRNNNRFVNFLQNW
uniref:Uncharacterized protein n=1 Tax=Rhizophora mucronata TaxID=61149 RepID=A0A2P2PYG4_RHIMU